MDKRKTFKISISNYKTLSFISSHLKNPYQAIKGREKKKKRRKRQRQSRNHSSAMKSKTEGSVGPWVVLQRTQDTTEAPTDTSGEQVCLNPACVPTMLRALHGLTPPDLSLKTTWPLTASSPGFQPSRSQLKFSSN